MRVATKHDLMRAVGLLILATIMLLPMVMISGCKRVPSDPNNPNYVDYRVRDAIAACKSQGRILAEYNGETGSFKCVRDDGTQ